LSIKDAVTASTKSWLFDVRESGATVGRLALEQMSARIKKWRARREKEGGVRLARVGGALELVHNERTECETCRLHPNERADSIVDALDNDETKVDFKPLYQCIHIYDALECKPELQRSYQQDRKVGSPVVAVADIRPKRPLY
jgi:hypothetical protein